MQGKDFIYFLFDENNNSYYAYGDTVLKSGPLKPLEFTPNGWTKIQLQNQRNPTYFAIDRSFSVPLEYLKDGGQILKHIYYNFGCEAKVSMAICKQELYFDATHYGFYYTLLYRGEIDLANFKHDGTKVTVNIMEGGLVKLIKAYENTKYEIQVDVPDAVEVLMDGIELKQQAAYIITNGATNDLGSHIVETTLLSTEEKQSIGALSTKRTAVGSAGAIFGTNQYFLKTGNSPTAVTIKYDFGISLSLAAGVGSVPNTHYFFQLRAYNSTGTQIIFNNLIDYNPGDPLLLYTHHRFTGSFNVTIPANSFVYLDSLTSISGNVTYFHYDDDNDLSIEYTYRHRETTNKALRPLYVFQQLISKISNGQYTAQSTFLQTIQDVTVSCGDAIRGISGSVIKTSLRDFFTSYNSDFGIGMGMIGNTLRLEEKGFWVQYTDVIDLGEVSKMKVSCANDLLINNIKIGTPNQDYDDVNGKQEFNTTHEYSAPITRIAKELNLVSVYRKDCYGIEFTRLNLDGKTTTDNDSDNDVFMIHIEDNPRGDGFYHLDRSLNAGATGLLTPSTVFNIYLTPARAFGRNGNYIRSLFYKLDSKFIMFQTNDKNDSLVADGITENGNVLIASLAPALFSCNYLEFETKVPLNLFEILSVSPLKAFKGTWAGWPFMGITNKISMQPGDNASQTFQLLAAPDQDFTPLITIDG